MNQSGRMRRLPSAFKQDLTTIIHGDIQNNSKNKDSNYSYHLT